MFFTRLGTLVAWLALLLAVARIGVAVFILWGTRDAEVAASWTARYLGTKSTGQAIDQAGTVIAFAIILGILTEISRSVRR